MFSLNIIRYPRFNSDKLNYDLNFFTASNVDVGDDFTQFIEEHKPLWFTRHDDDVNPAICGECWLRFK